MIIMKRGKKVLLETLPIKKKNFNREFSTHANYHINLHLRKHFLIAVVKSNTDRQPRKAGTYP